MPWSPFNSTIAIVGLFLIGMVGFDFAYRGSHQFPIHPQWPTGKSHAAHGRHLLHSYGCGSCHVIPGVRKATGRVGPKLDGFVDQMFIAGILTNTPENLSAWLQNPKVFNERTAMPNLNVTPEDARDMIAYLYSTR
jgi:cytochrome c2